ncbi:phosphoenolpyruvate carboxylase [Verrucomicrobiaceae bacterium N1E253]|uniref:Phosphoenolpyruvate carboxylase n=1 Tax=Oceaniferula marina TaxID=2748318 RepID=A0A851GP28_9BACT|nr:phosphoenolpyruvate carboxylase [Oceaniferula marina]NWK56580.1 phosphoenolpyruvate carboxylase [Oceaniferula marina]
MTPTTSTAAFFEHVHSPEFVENIRCANDDYRREGFEQLERRLRILMDMLADVLEPEQALVESIPWRGVDVRDRAHGPDLVAKTAQLQAICFEILNMVEERTALRIRHRRRKDFGMAAEQGMWGRVIGQLKQQGFTEDEVLEALPEVDVTAVLTAHPTEAKRATVRERHLALYKDLVSWDRNQDDPVTLAKVMESIQVGLETLWHTGEIHASRPSILAELRHTIYYLREVFPRIIGKLDLSLEAAWQSAGWDVAKLRASKAYPRLTFGTWVGGDRDGHPLVTASVTQDTLKRLHKHALRIHKGQVKEAAKALTLSPASQEVPAALTARVLELRKELGVEGREVAATHAREPWRCLAYLMSKKLDAKRAYTSVDEYGADLDLMSETLLQIGAKSTARNVVQPLMRLADVFGFHLATLDVRQNSPFHDQAAAQMLEIVGVEDGAGFADWPEEKRVAYLEQELRNERPFRPWKADEESEAGKVRACFRVLRQHAQQHGSAGFGLYVVSMTRQVSDMLLVHLFARECRMADWKDGLWVSRVPVCPLFETGDDLNRAGKIVQHYLSLPSGHHFLRAGVSKRMPVMVGYSDSNKDSGLLSGQWYLQKAQAEITRACQDAGARCEFFHGRGGTISRGAGPVQWFLRSLPTGSLSGAMRVTEQGEVIPRKYAHRSNAAYHMELLMAGVAGVTVANRRKQEPSSPGGTEYQGIMEWMSGRSRAAYRAFLEEPGFMEFYRQATPIDALEHGCFGSRPARRTGTASLDDLRAIPWVFSWTQARYYLPGWFGVGSALDQLKMEKPEDFERMFSLIHEEPFLRYLLTNVETNLVSADLHLMQAYAGLVSDESLRERFQGMIESEYFRTSRMIDELFGSGFAQRRPRIQRTLEMRDLPLRLLHEQQIRLLADWRACHASGDQSSEGELLNALQYSVNAIASGLRTTG